MEQQEQVLLTPQVIEQLKNNKSYKWRDIQRKKYSVFAIQAPEGYVCANLLEQFDSYTYLMNKFGRVIVHSNELTEEDKNVLHKKCYITDGVKILLCGLKGELWTVDIAKVSASYINIDGSKIDKIPNKWIELSRIPEETPSGKATQIPINIKAQYNTSWGDVLIMNDLSSSGHGKGDILIIGNDGRVSPMNNEVFALSFNQNIGGWANSGCILPTKEIKGYTLDEVRVKFKFENRKLLSFYEELKKNYSDLVVTHKGHHGADAYLILRLKDNNSDAISFYSDGTYAQYELPNVAAPYGGESDKRYKVKNPQQIIDIIEGKAKVGEEPLTLYQEIAKKYNVVNLDKVGHYIRETNPELVINLGNYDAIAFYKDNTYNFCELPNSSSHYGSIGVNRCSIISKEKLFELIDNKIGIKPNTKDIKDKVGEEPLTLYQEIAKKYNVVNLDKVGHYIRETNPELVINLGNYDAIAFYKDNTYNFCELPNSSSHYGSIGVNRCPIISKEKLFELIDSKSVIKNKTKEDKASALEQFYKELREKYSSQVVSYTTPYSKDTSVIIRIGSSSSLDAIALYPDGKYANFEPPNVAAPNGSVSSDRYEIKSKEQIIDIIEGRRPIVEKKPEKPFKVNLDWIKERFYLTDAYDIKVKDTLLSPDFVLLGKNRDERFLFYKDGSYAKANVKTDKRPSKIKLNSKEETKKVLQQCELNDAEFTIDFEDIKEKYEKSSSSHSVPYGYEIAIKSGSYCTLYLYPCRAYAWGEDRNVSEPLGSADEFIKSITSKRHLENLLSQCNLKKN